MNNTSPANSSKPLPKWLGKLGGGILGLAIGGPLGGAIGIGLGHLVDHHLHADGIHRGTSDGTRIDSAFFEATYTVLGHIAKADGRVSERDIAFAESVMNHMRLDTDARRSAIALYRRGKDPDFRLERALTRFRPAYLRNPHLLRAFLELQVQAAYADGPPNTEQRAIFDAISDGLGLPRAFIRHIEQTAAQQRGRRDGKRGRERVEPSPATGAPGLAQAYTELGVASTASDEEITHAYRRLLSRHHPDKLAASGLSDERLKAAADRTHRIRKAYEAITRARGV